MENININNVHKKLRQIVGDIYMTFEIEIDAKGEVEFSAYVSPNYISKRFTTSTPEQLYEDIQHWLQQQKRKNRKVDTFNINLCGQ